MPNKPRSAAAGKPCATCDQFHAAARGQRPCRGHISSGPRKGQACTKAARKGQDVCHNHGGAAAQNVRAGRRRNAELEALKTLRRFGEPVDTSPTEALLDAVRWTAGYVGWLRLKVAAAESDGELTQWVGEYRARGASVWVDLLGQWHDRLVRICAEAIKANIDERRVKLAEQQGQLVAEVIRDILGDLKLNAEQQELVGKVVPFRLRRLAG